MDSNMNPEVINKPSGWTADQMKGEMPVKSGNGGFNLLNAAKVFSEVGLTAALLTACSAGAGSATEAPSPFATPGDASAPIVTPGTMPSATATEGPLIIPSEAPFGTPPPSEAPTPVVTATPTPEVTPKPTKAPTPKPTPEATPAQPQDLEHLITVEHAGIGYSTLQKDIETAFKPYPQYSQYLDKTIKSLAQCKLGIPGQPAGVQQQNRTAGCVDVAATAYGMFKNAPDAKGDQAFWKVAGETIGYATHSAGVPADVMAQQLRQQFPKG